MKSVIDNSSIDLDSLLDAFKAAFPDIWESRERSLILPQRLGDLEKPEVLSQMKNKILQLNKLEEMLVQGSINQKDYPSMRIQILTNK
jgi:hypothetical protein